ncbi:SCAN domain-containing protein 3-like [Acyrthosiphon pisum]|uniref:Uncharacterized protein n=1 Tax=Acyrthosiphon pisum TaxID=7029 RepID=A0A8R2JL87_ACYPI|nr:SCAN domain-containing protein 3-like [Acyrthosiphon pisum]
MMLMLAEVLKRRISSNEVRDKSLKLFEEGKTSSKSLFAFESELRNNKGNAFYCTYYAGDRGELPNLQIKETVKNLEIWANKTGFNVSPEKSIISIFKKKKKVKELEIKLNGTLCKENEEEFNRLFLHTEVRWLSKGACFNMFWNLFDFVLEFLEEKDVKLKDRLLLFKSDVAYMNDLFAKFNSINSQLQSDELNLITSKSVISAFKKKLTLWKTNIGRKELSQFPVLADLHNNSEISFDNIQVYCQHLNSLHIDFSERFKYILSLEVPQWVMNSFINIEIAEIQIQEELIELSTNETLKSSFKGSDRLTEFWLQTNIIHHYPELWTLVKKILIAFPSSHLVERGFSTVTDLITKKRNRLDIVTRGDLRLKLTNIEPNIKKLAKNHQVQPSH